MVLASYVMAFQASKCFPRMTELDWNRTDSGSYKYYRHKREDTLIVGSAVMLERSHRHQQIRPDSCDAVRSNSDVVAECHSDHLLPCYCTLNLRCSALNLACDRSHYSA